MDSKRLRLRLFAGIGCISAASLLLEVTLTRVFSLTMWYHFAFMSVSLALLGSAAAGVFLYLMRRFFPQSRLGVQLPLIAALFSLAILVCFVAQLGIPFMPNKSLAGGMNMLLIYAILAVPFFLGGLCLTLALTHLSQQIGRLYFALSARFARIGYAGRAWSCNCHRLGGGQRRHPFRRVRRNQEDPAGRTGLGRISRRAYGGQRPLERGAGSVRERQR